MLWDLGPNPSPSQHLAACLGLIPTRGYFGAAGSTRAPRAPQVMSHNTNITSCHCSHRAPVFGWHHADCKELKPQGAETPQPVMWPDI